MILQDVVGADPAPDDVRMARSLQIPIRKGGPAIVGPGQFPNAGMSLHPLDAKPLAKRAGPQVGNELLHRGKESSLLIGA
jgi:hypothetical protein